MTGSHPDPRPSDDDLDPTGVRALLANLPDPGPMPDELMNRISQSLELEQQRRASAAASSAASNSSAASSSTGASETSHDSPTEGELSSVGGQVVSLTAERQRRRPGRTVLWLGGAAAVAMVATVSVNQLVGNDTAGDSGVAANVPVSSDSADDGAEAGGAEEDAGSNESSAADSQQDEAAQAPQAEPTPDQDEEHLGAGEPLGSTRIYAMAGTVELTSGGWPDEVSQWLGSGPGRGESDFGATQADACLETGGLDTSQANTVVLSRAEWDAAPATLVVTEAADGDTAWVLSPDCQEVLTGPTSLD